MRVFKNRWFARFTRQEGISDRDVCEAVARAARGLVDATLGGEVIKQRIPRPGEGRSGGYRSIILFRIGERAFFVYGFPKNKRDNISDDELKAFRDLAQQYLTLTNEELATALEGETLSEVFCDEQDL